MRNKTVLQVLSILSPSIILRALAMDIFLPCLPRIVTDFQVPFSTAQWVLSIYLIGSGIGQLLMGPLADRFGRCKVMQASLVLFAVSSLSCSMADSIYTLILSRLIQGLGACGTTVVTLAIVRDLFEDHVTPKIYSYVSSIIGLAPIVAPLLGGGILLWTGTWRSCFHAVSIFSLIALAINYMHLKETNPRLDKGGVIEKLDYFNNYKIIFSNKKFLVYTFCSISGLCGLFLFFSMSSILLMDNLGVSPYVFGCYLGINSLMYLGGNILSPWLVIKIGLNKLIMLGSVFIMFGSVAMFIYNRQFGLSISGLILPNLVITSGVGFILGPCVSGAMQPFRHMAGMASASYGALLYCSTALLVAAVMQYPIINAAPLAITMVIMGGLCWLVARSQLLKPL